MAGDFGPQPLGEVMRRHDLTPAHLVRASTEQLSFKMVQKGCKGRYLTPNIRRKILTALRVALAPTEPEKAAAIAPKDLFNYD